MLMTITIPTLLSILLIGAIAGWLAGLLVKGRSQGIIASMVIGVLGAVLAAWLLPKVGIYIGGGLVATIINATIGAVILLVVLRLLAKR
jgi:uncharacterized membrane protein YeaQ/YmgE (transglycosylase-associated protein family)